MEKYTTINNAQKLQGDLQSGKSNVNGPQSSLQLGAESSVMVADWPAQGPPPRVNLAWVFCLFNHCHVEWTNSDAWEPSVHRHDPSALNVSSAVPQALLDGSHAQPLMTRAQAGRVQACSPQPPLWSDSARTTSMVVTIGVGVGV